MEPLAVRKMQGAIALASWIAADTTRSRCWLARELGTDRCVVRRWLAGASIPRRPARQRIAWISQGAVPPESWDEVVETVEVTA